MLWFRLFLFIIFTSCRLNFEQFAGRRLFHISVNVKHWESPGKAGGLPLKLTTALRENDGFAQYSDGRENRLAHFTEIPGHRWMLVNTVDRRDISGQLNELRAIVLALGLLFVIVGSVAAFFVGRAITKQIVFVTGRLKDIAEGEADLTRRDKQQVQRRNGRAFWLF